MTSTKSIPKLSLSEIINHDHINSSSVVWTKNVQHAYVTPWIRVDFSCPFPQLGTACTWTRMNFKQQWNGGLESIPHWIWMEIQWFVLWSNRLTFVFSVYLNCRWSSYLRHNCKVGCTRGKFTQRHLPISKAIQPSVNCRWKSTKKSPASSSV